jgi:DNA-binding MarR family transcriptional regulator
MDYNTISGGLNNADELLKLEEAHKLSLLLPAIMRQIFTLEEELTVNLPIAQLRVCLILREGTRTMSDLSRELGVSLSAMTQIADRLERANLVSRVADRNDRRIRCLQLTPQGEKIMLRHEESRIQNVLAVFNCLSTSARMEILAALDTLMKATIAAKTNTPLQETCPPGPHHRKEDLLISKVIS